MQFIFVKLQLKQTNKKNIVKPDAINRATVYNRQKNNSNRQRIMRAIN